MANEITVDALPYYDKGYNEEGVREAAAAMIDEETKRYRPTKNYLQYLPTPNYHAYETDILKNEYERLSARQPMELLSMKRYELPTPPSGQKNDVTAWEECVKNSKAQLEHQAIRIQNLELMQEFGPNAWKAYNDLLVKMLEEAQQKLQKIKKDIQDINWARKSEQIAAGEKLHLLEADWVNLVSKNYEIEEAINKVKIEIYQLEKDEEVKQEEIEVNGT